jgi:hypothetical protein
MTDEELDALDAELDVLLLREASYGGLLDSLAQAFMYDQQLLEARQARQYARKAAQTARARRREAVEQKRAMRAQTAALQSQASQERRAAREQARAEQQRVRQERARKEKEAQRLAQMRLATQQEAEQRRTVRAGQRRDTAETRRSVAQVANTRLLSEATADPSRIVTRAGAPIQAAAALTAPSAPSPSVSPPVPSDAPASVGADDRSTTPRWLGYVLAGSIAATFAVAFYADANQPKPAPVRPPRYPRLPIP